MKIITTHDFNTEVLEHSGVVLVDFYADWCGPCRMLGPMLEELDNDNNDKGVKFVKINVDDNQKTAALYGVMSIPTVIIFKDGKILDQKVGVQPKQSYADTIQYARS